MKYRLLLGWIFLCTFVVVVSLPGFGLKMDVNKIAKLQSRDTFQHAYSVHIAEGVIILDHQSWPKSFVARSPRTDFSFLVVHPSWDIGWRELTDFGRRRFSSVRGVDWKIDVIAFPAWCLTLPPLLLACLIWKRRRREYLTSPSFAVTLVAKRVDAGASQLSHVDPRDDNISGKVDRNVET